MREKIYSNSAPTINFCMIFMLSKKKKKKKNFNVYLYLEFLPEYRGFPLTDEWIRRCHTQTHTHTHIHTQWNTTCPQKDGIMPFVITQMDLEG